MDTHDTKSTVVKLGRDAIGYTCELIETCAQERATVDTQQAIGAIRVAQFGSMLAEFAITTNPTNGSQGT